MVLLGLVGREVLSVPVTIAVEWHAALRAGDAFAAPVHAMQALRTHLDGLGSRTIVGRADLQADRTTVLQGRRSGPQVWMVSPWSWWNLLPVC